MTMSDALTSVIQGQRDATPVAGRQIGGDQYFQGLQALATIGLRLRFATQHVDHVVVVQRVAEAVHRGGFVTGLANLVVVRVRFGEFPMLNLVHRDAADPVEVLAAFGGFELAMMVGVMLVAGSKRQLILADGMSACAALMVAAQIAPAVTDYCVFCRSNSHHGLDQALALFHASALLELGMESTDGTGATLAFPLVRSAAALLTEVAEGEDPGPTLPGDLGPASNFGAPV